MGQIDGACNNYEKYFPSHEEFSEIIIFIHYYT